MEVTTTGVYGATLENIKQKLQAAGGFYWNGDLTASTKVLIVVNRNSRKYEVARRQGLPCVSPEWVLNGACDLATLGQYEVSESLQGKEVCSTSLQLRERGVVEQICAKRGAVFNSTLTRNCNLLVVPDSLPAVTGSDHTNPKVRFAVRNHIPIVPFREFMMEYRGGVSMEATELEPYKSYSCRPTRQSIYPSVSQITHRATEVDRSGEWTARASALPSQNFSELRACMDDVVAYLSPPWKVHARPGLPQLLKLSGINFSAELTDGTTHVIVLGEECEEIIFPRPGLEFISVRWIEKCVLECRRISCVPFRATVKFCPAILFASITSEKKAQLEEELREKQLACVVQDSLKLCSTSTSSSGLTTHLVVPREKTVHTEEVRHLVESVDNTVCQLVDVQWVEQSVLAGKWLDWMYFRIALPSCEEMQTRQEVNDTLSIRPMATTTTLDDLEMVTLHDDGPEDGAAYTPTAKHAMREEGASQSQSEPPDMEGDGGKSEARVSPPPSDPRPIEESMLAPNESLPSLTLEALLTDLEGGRSNKTKSISPTIPKDDSRASASVDFVPSSGFPSLRASAAVQLSDLSRPSARHTMQRVVHSFKADNNIESQEVVYAKTALHGLYAHPEGLEPPVVQPSAQLVRAEPMPLEQEPLSLVKQPVLLINKDVYNELNIDMLLGNVSRTYTLTTDAKECTHFIVGKLAKTELFLCCLAGGKWIVAPSFLTASSERGNFVQEAAHEWNVERVKQTCLRSSTLLLGEACHRQRRASERPFTQWDVILTCSGPARTAGFHRVLESGGCKSIAHCTSKEVLEKAQSGELQSHHPDTTLHILSDDNMWSESDMEQLAEWCKAPVLRLEYMVHFMSVENPNPAEYELLQNVRSKKRSRTASR